MDSIYRILKISALCSELERVRPVPWHTTTCQDINHSVYCTLFDLKKAVMGCENNKSIEAGSATVLITTLLRPFCLSWHSVFFQNVGSEGEKNMRTKPVHKVSESNRVAFRNNFFELRDAIKFYCDNFHSDDYLASVVDANDVYPKNKQFKGEKVQWKTKDITVTA